MEYISKINQKHIIVIKIKHYSYNRILICVFDRGYADVHITNIIKVIN